MAARNSSRYITQDVQEIAALIRSLESGTKKGEAGRKTFSCKKTIFDVADSELSLESWRFQDWDYKRTDLPTYARGLFTTRNFKRQPEIAIRGYDKFFNIGEVEATRWENIERDTTGPYELSLKENGCIIFISGLCDDSLLVCSKHSTGARSDVEVSHALAGERWVDSQLKALRKTRQDLARELRKRNVTAVAELCDDDFEEHILAYNKESAGLYLHGMNLNIPDFTTYPGSLVQAFADEWGFKRTNFLMIDHLSEARTFLESVAETGSYNGRDVEGFVVRCKSRLAKGPYQDWFFKYKFEEPYLMYRQWRECTKATISGKPAKFKKHVKITEEYLLYARKRLTKDPGLAKSYNMNHGIIALRDDFLKEKNLKGSDIIRQEYAAIGGAPEEISQDIILVPIATIGCGKTTIALALTRLFNWGHVQNDNITGKGRPPRFTAEVLAQLMRIPAVFADRNNALKRERKQIIEDVHRQSHAARLVALNFVHSKQNLGEIRKVTQGRVLSRGDNHQTIQAANNQSKAIGIMEGFISRFEPLQPSSSPDDGFDAIIDLDPTLDSRHNLETVISQLHSVYPKLFTDMPSSEDLDDAINFALHEYKPDLRHEVAKGPKNNPNRQEKFASSSTSIKKKPLEYIGVWVPKSQILEILDKTFDSQPASRARFYLQLQQTRRVQSSFHVTLVHRASEKQNPEIWQRYSAFWAAAGSAENKLGDCQIQLERIVWDNRLMGIVVRVVDEDWQSVNAVPHITIGTRGDEVKPKESNDLLKRWLEVGSGEDSGIGELVIEGSVVLRGEVKGVLSR